MWFNSMPEYGQASSTVAAIMKNADKLVFCLSTSIEKLYSRLLLYYDIWTALPFKK